MRSLVALHSALASEPDTAERKRLRKSWAALIRRVYEVDPLLCVCGATMRIVAIITERSAIRRSSRTWRKWRQQPRWRDRAPALPATRPGPAPDPFIN